MKKQQSFTLSYIQLKTILLSKESTQLPPYLGSTLRGVIGHALEQDQAAYQYLYENHVLSDNKKDIINPYIIIPPRQKENTYKVEDELEFDIILLGDAQKYTHSIIKALSKINEFGLGVSRSPFMLKKVVHKQSQRIIWLDGSFNSLAILKEELPYLELTNVKGVVFQIHTPLRIRRNGRILTKLDFPTIIRNITSRIKELVKRYGGWADEQEIARLMILSQEIVVTEENLWLEKLVRYSNKQEKKIDMSGLLGSIEFEGDLTPFVPWIYAIQKLHIGRNTTFGMGNITVEFM